MFLKLTHNGGRTYLQLAESYRDPESGKPRQRHIANLGRLDQLCDSGNVERLIESLIKVNARTGEDRRREVATESEPATFEPARSVGAVWTVVSVWHQLGLTALLRRHLPGSQSPVKPVQLIQLLVINRLCAPCSKLAVLEWLATVAIPGLNSAKVYHQQLLRAMDVLLPLKPVLERHLAKRLQVETAEVVFYDLTTVRIHAEGEAVETDLRRLGFSKDLRGIGRQYVVGLVQTPEGLPLMHEVFAGNVREASTLQAMIERLSQRLGLRRMVVIADRGLLSLDNVALLESLRLPNGRPVEYVLAVAGRRYTQRLKPVTARHQALVEAARRRGAEVFERVADDTEEFPSQTLRYWLVAHDPQRLRQSRRARARQLNPILRQAHQLGRKLDAQAQGKRGRGRRLSDMGAAIQLVQAISEAHASRWLKVDRSHHTFNWWWEVEAFKQDLALDGKLVLLTNVAEPDAEYWVKRYKALADIERSFRVLKSHLAIAPVYHRQAGRLQAHTLICFLALVIDRVLRQRLKAHQIDLSPAAALRQLEPVQIHAVRLVTGQRLSNIGQISPAQRRLFKAMEVEVPTRQGLERVM